MTPLRLLPLAVTALVNALSSVNAYAPISPHRNTGIQQVRRISTRPSASAPALYVSSTANNDDDAFLSFARTLEEEKPRVIRTSSTASKARRATADRSVKTSTAEEQSWLAAIDELLDPMTPLSRRQTLLAKLAQSNQDIQQSVITALRDRKIDGLLTPNSKKVQDGTRVVARQLANDILPSLARAPPPGSNPSSLLPDPNDVSKVGSRIFNALSNQVQKNWELFQGDLANPERIPQRLSKQTEDFVTEARNVFSETPVGLKEPPYTVVKKTETYEIRDYEGYSVACTSMRGGAILENTEPIDNTNLANTGAAFNTLAAYLFGANQQGKSMDMTTPVTTTSWGEMRFYLSERNAIPDPLDDERSSSLYETGSVQILDIPAARLAVKKFTGFVTEGEIARQKDELLSALMMDDVELDVAHGDPVSHVIFQYNPPYTLPIVRRNEISVAVRKDDDILDLQKHWGDNENVEALPPPNNASPNNAQKKSPRPSEDDLSPSDA